MDAITKEKMEREPDLGKIYGFQWRRFNGTNGNETEADREWECRAIQGYDQLQDIIYKLHKDPSDR